MKILDIALKDLTRSFRSTFALIFMFVISLLVPVLFFFMFGNIAEEKEGFEVPVTKVALVNLDEGEPAFAQAMSRFPGGMQAASLGAFIVSVLQSHAFADLLEVRLEVDAATARDLVAVSKPAWRSSSRPTSRRSSPRSTGRLPSSSTRARF